MRRRFGPYEEVNVAIAALVLGGPESVRVVCFTAAAVNNRGGLCNASGPLAVDLPGDEGP